jgi:acyl-[acyl carrier protein]--UDP-N-acetylglucosamine O-acyltransferase
MSFIDCNTVKKALQELAENVRFQQAVNNIKVGKFKRDKANPDYQDRLVYTQELRQYLYNPAILNCILSDKEMKTLFFRTFGYRGSVEFTIYPNCWLRDLPLLDIGENTYLADGILLGTNQVTPDQEWICTGSIRIGDNCVFDQGCAVGYNSRIGSNSMIGFKVSIGLKNRIGKNVRIGGASNISHGCRIGNNVVLSDFCRIGSFSVIEEGVELPEFTDVPAFSQVTQEGIFSRRRKAA